jgi:hypothetical protein
MKTGLSLTLAAGLWTAFPGAGMAGQSEWATAGKVLTGVIAAGVLFDALRPHPAPVVVYQQPPPVVYSAPPPTVVYTYSAAPQTVYVQAPPVVVVQAPSYGYPGYYGPGCRGPFIRGPICRPVHVHGGHAGVEVHFGGHW